MRRPLVFLALAGLLSVAATVSARSEESPSAKIGNVLRSPLAASEARFVDVALQAPSPGACHVLSPDPAFVKEMLVDVASIGAPGGPTYERRVALVVGNGAYRSVSSLRNPPSDAASAARMFQALGFTVVMGTDLTAGALEQCLRSFSQHLQAGGGPADVSLFYYAGHGVQFASQTDNQSRNYMLAVDAAIDAAGKGSGFKQIDAVLADMRAHSKQAVFFYDACRNAPFSAGAVKAIDGRSVRRQFDAGAAAVDETPTATSAEIFISYATALGKTADDGAGAHSPFTEALLEHLPTPGATIGQAVEAASDKVKSLTNGGQTPWISSSITTRLTLNGAISKEELEAKVAAFAADSARSRERGERGKAMAAALKGLPADWAKGGPEHIEARKALSQAENDPRVLFTGHKGAVTVAAVSPNGKIVATGSIDGSAKVWDAATGALRHTLKQHESFGVDQARFSADGRALATSSADGTTKIWDVSTGALKTTVAGLVGAFSPDGRRLATGADRRAVRLFNAATGALEIEASAIGERIADVAFSPDGRFLAAASLGRVEIFDAASGAAVMELAAHNIEPDPMVENTSTPRPARVWRVAWSPDGRRLWAAGETLTLWDVPGWTVQPTGGLGGWRAQSLAVSADGSQIIYGRDIDNVIGVGFSAADEPIYVTAAGKDARLTDSRRARFITEAPGVSSMKHSDLDLDAKGARFATASSGASTAAAGVSAGAFLWTANGAFLRQLTGPAAGAGAVKFSPDGGRIAAAWGDGAATIFDAASGAVLASLGPAVGEPLTGIAWSPDGGKIATSDNSGNIGVWNAATGALAFAVAAEKGTLRVAFAPDGRLRTLSSFGLIEMWDATGAPLPNIGTGFELTDFAVSPTGEIAVAGNGEIRVGSRTVAQSLGAIARVALTGDGRILALMQDGAIRAWDAQTGQDLEGANRIGVPPAGFVVASDGRAATTAGSNVVIRYVGRWGDALQRHAREQLTDDLEIEVARERIRYWEVAQELLE